MTEPPSKPAGAGRFLDGRLLRNRAVVRAVLLLELQGCFHNVDLRTVFG
jgi:hypothetical protein